ncbi:MAG TPA: V-type ATP synthase subunit E family protein [Clostridia bacterium]|nr:V-type ATP synthase subunit E family protein [Clostridia bacterium]
MSSVTISGTNKLAERIVNDAEEEARALLTEAESEARFIREESEKAVSARCVELNSQKESAVKSLIGGYRTRATLDGKKDALRKKRVVIDAAFTRAYEAMLALSAERRKAICANLLAAQAEGGETVLPAEQDRAALIALVASMPEKKLKVSGDSAKIDGGFILLGSGYEKDCSFKSLLTTVRDAEETAVYQLLFD